MTPACDKALDLLEHDERAAAEAALQAYADAAIVGFEDHALFRETEFLGWTLYCTSFDPNAPHAGAIFRMMRATPPDGAFKLMPPKARRRKRVAGAKRHPAPRLKHTVKRATGHYAKSLIARYLLLVAAPPRVAADAGVAIPAKLQALIAHALQTLQAKRHPPRASQIRIIISHVERRADLIAHLTSKARTGRPPRAKLQTARPARDAIWPAKRPAARLVANAYAAAGAWWIHASYDRSAFEDPEVHPRNLLH